MEQLIELEAAAALPRSSIHAAMAGSFAAWWAVSLAVHVISWDRWKGYASLTPLERRQWCNKITSGLHAALLAYNQAFHLRHPALLADPLGLAGRPPAFHYFWASVLAGYLLYDTVYGLLFYSLSSAAPFLVHHVIGLAGCVLGAHYGRLALFGLAIQVWFEGTTPLLHVVGCLKIAKQQGTRLYRLLGLIFAVQFFVFRVVVANGYLAWLLRAVLQLEQAPWWAWAGVAVFAALSALNLFWFTKLLRMAFSGRRFSKNYNGKAVSEASTAVATSPANPAAGVSATVRVLSWRQEKKSM